MGAEHPLPELIQHTVTMIITPQDVMRAMLVCRAARTTGAIHLWNVLRATMCAFPPAGYDDINACLLHNTGYFDAYLTCGVSLSRTGVWLRLIGYVDPVYRAYCMKHSWITHYGCAWIVTVKDTVRESGPTGEYREACNVFMSRLFPDHAAFFTG